MKELLKPCVRPNRFEELEDELDVLWDLTIEQRDWMINAVCEDALEIARSRPDCEQVLAYVDPIPES